MAYAQTLSPPSIHQQYRDVHTSNSPPMQRRPITKQRFVADLSQCLFDFVIQLLPTPEEMAVKEDVRKLLERLIRTIEPDSRLLSFGSTANGFSLRNSDMDLCCLIDSEERLSATDLVTMLGDLLERETKFHVKPLPHARIPIVKLSLDPSPGLPLGIACDIGFENRLALENTRLLMCYAMIDPTRVRTMVLFLKVWSKRRKINSPYKGTLSSYGYVLLVIYFLVHVKNPPVLPNLQQMPPLRPISTEDTHLNGHNIWFFDDIDLLRQRWHSENTETVAELLIDFFRYYSRDFLYNTGVASIRAGLLKKESKGWQSEVTGNRYDSRERNRLCIEDPFETDFNVARCVTKDGLYTIRGEFMRASRILQTRPERAIVALAELCEERKDEELVAAPPYHGRPAPLPPQTPYTVGNQSLRPKVSERFSPPAQFFEPGSRQASVPVTLRPPPEHMAPKRGKWTSPPPPEAPSADHTLFESQLGMGLQLATSSTEARERDKAYNSSESNSEVFTDDGSDLAEDDIKSVRSYTEGTSPHATGNLRRPSLQMLDAHRNPPSFANGGPDSSRSSSTARGRFQRSNDRLDVSPTTPFRPPSDFLHQSQACRSETNKRSTSGPPRSSRGSIWPSNVPLAVVTPLPPSPESPLDPRFSESMTNVFYQTTTTKSPRPTILYPSPGSHSSFLTQYQAQSGFTLEHVPPDIIPSDLPPSLSSLNPRAIGTGLSTPRANGPETPTPATYSAARHSRMRTISATTDTQSSLSNDPSSSHASTSTLISNEDDRPALTSPIVEPNTSPSLPPLPQTPLSNGQLVPVHTHHHTDEIGTNVKDRSLSPRPSDTTSNSSSPAPSSSTGYATSISRSPSPHSSPGSPPHTAVPVRHQKGDEENPLFPKSLSSLTVNANEDDGVTDTSIVVEVERLEKKS
ncbi:hypothetical protein CVT24_000288 [Panaeolus cyanescens]|uniref:polynucleotide adenylyltransferase n=1 Tax=Panaeolus cyanescens TaxID=181874 RepID=A0A409VWC1_9AGAR|nr:hypothetical protein CVT24_000288 [Panaeolus cyanescens]